MKIRLFMSVLLAALLIFVAASSGCIAGNNPGIPKDSAYSYGHDIKTVSDWELTLERKNLADYETEQRKNLLAEGTSDAAMWQYQRGTELLVVNAVIYNSQEDLDKAVQKFGVLRWVGLIAKVDVGENGIAGVYKITGNNPLVLVTTKGKLLFYEYYYNNNSKYDSTERAKDMALLTKVAKEVVGVNTVAPAS